MFRIFTFYIPLQSERASSGIRTLQGSLGQTSDYDYDNLPDNINFDDPVDNHNIAIKDVQVSLSSRMETFIRDNYPKYEQFFTDEKEALDD